MSVMDRAAPDGTHGRPMDEQARPQPAHRRLGQRWLASLADRVAHSGLDSCPAWPVPRQHTIARAPVHTAHNADGDDIIHGHGLGVRWPSEVIEGAVWNRTHHSAGPSHAVFGTAPAARSFSCRRPSDLVVVAHRAAAQESRDRSEELVVRWVA